MLYYKYLRVESIYYFCEIDYVFKTEQWLPVVGYEGIYEVSDLGRIKSISYGSGKKARILKSNESKGGYLQVNLWICKKSISRKIHKLVSMAFLGHVPCGHNLVINHKDVDVLNNKVINLEITTCFENANKKKRPSASRHKGVSFNKKMNKWFAFTKIKGKSKHIGTFNTEEEAYLAREKYCGV